MNSHIVLDNCLLLNILSCGILNDLLKMNFVLYSPKYVIEKEALYIGKEKKALPVEELDLIKALEPNESESEMILELSKSHRNRGEAYCIALALGREYELGTDDGKAIKMYYKYNSIKDIWTTPRIIKYWAKDRQDGVPGKDSPFLQRKLAGEPNE